MPATHVFGNVSGLGQLQAAFARTLAVVLDMQLLRYKNTIALPDRPQTCQWRLHDAVLELERAQLQRGEEGGVFERREAGRAVCLRHPGGGVVVVVGKVAEGFLRRCSWSMATSGFFVPGTSSRGDHLHAHGGHGGHGMQQGGGACRCRNGGGCLTCACAIV